MVTVFLHGRICSSRISIFCSVQYSIYISCGRDKDCALVFEQKFVFFKTMIDFVKKGMLAGVGLAVVTKEKVIDSLDELVEAGRLSKVDAMAAADKIVDEASQTSQGAKQEASHFLNDLLKRANLVTRDQYDALERRVIELEGRLHKEFPNEES